MRGRSVDVYNPSMFLRVIMGFTALTLAGCPAPATLNRGITPDEHTRAFFPITGEEPHALNANTVTGPMTCDSCHGGTSSFSTYRCIECHQNDPSPPTTVHAGIAGFLPFNESCLECHSDGRRGNQLGVEPHSINQFPIRPTDVHGGAAYEARLNGSTSCEGCHASVENRSIVLCAECHAEDDPPIATQHAALLASFQADNQNCKACHAETPVNPSMHPLSAHTFYDPNHHGAVCVNCHEKARPPPQEWAIDFSVGTCTGCHVHPPECTFATVGPCLNP